MSDLHAIIPRFARQRILVIGDIILDHFVRGEATRISPEAPVPVVKVLQEEFLLGGAANVLKNIVDLGGAAELCGMIGQDAAGARLLELLAPLGDSGAGIIRGERQTTLKTRVLAQRQQVVRIDREEIGAPAPDLQKKLARYISHNLARFDAVLISDYAKGIMHEHLMHALMQGLAQERQRSGRPLPLVVDPKPANMEYFTGATVITPNHHEASAMSGQAIHGEESLLAAARSLQGRLACEAVLITRGAAGMALLESQGSLKLIPTVAREVFDVTGAGDTVAATLALGLASGASMADAAMLANHAAGLVVAKVGTASVTAGELMTALDNSPLLNHHYQG